MHIHLLCKLEFNILSCHSSTLYYIRAHSTTFGAMAFCFTVQSTISYKNQTRSAASHCVFDRLLRADGNH